MFEFLNLNKILNKWEEVEEEEGKRKRKIKNLDYFIENIGSVDSILSKHSSQRFGTLNVRLGNNSMS